MKLEVGKTYITRGGWNALVIWKSMEFPAKKDELYISGSIVFHAIHKPKTKDESSPVSHRESGKVWGAIFAVNSPPDYDRESPADIIKEK